VLRISSSRRQSTATLAVGLPWFKRALWFLVIYGILYVLISPLPEVDATASGSSVITFFILVTYALLGLFIPYLGMALHPFWLRSASPPGVLDKTCVRLC
jgi:hypothetical protein